MITETAATPGVVPDGVPAPSGVELVTSGGDRIPVGCVYAGMRSGWHVWEVQAPPGGWTPDITGLYVEEYPPGATLQLPTVVVGREGG